MWKTGPNAALGLAAVALVAAAVDVTPVVPVGTIATFVDDTGTQGPAEFIYLPGVAGTVAGDLVSYNLLPGAFTSVRATSVGLVNTGRPMAVAIGPVGAGQYGWYQISGTAIVNVAAGSVTGPLFTSAVAGTATSTASAGAQLIGARISSAEGTPSAGKSYVTISRPAMQTQIT